MKEIVAKLRRLNELDIRRQALRKDVERLPAELAEKRREPAALRVEIERLNEERRSDKLAAEEAEMEAKSGYETLKRYAAQLNHVRNNKEMSSLRRQMDAQRAWNKENEDKALGFLQKVEENEGKLAKLLEQAEHLERELEEETRRVEREVEGWKKELAAMDAQREKAASEIPEPEISLYNRAAGRGKALAEVKDGHCAACFMKLTPQVEDTVLLGREMVVCSSCGRILTNGDA